jgi:ABC-2 type transport system ATP-binding protein
MHTMVAEHALEARGLTKHFGEFVAVDDLSFTVEFGTVTGFLGPNGAGKTTTLRMLLGLVRPTSGEGFVLGAPYRALADPMRSVGAVLEATSFHPGRSARSHLRILCTANGIPLARADELIDLVGLRDAAKRRVGGFSLGMRQRLALAGALVGDPRVLVLDEPANGLDPEGIRWLRDFLRYLAQQGKAVLVSSHVLAEVQQTVDHVVIIRAGRAVRSGPLRDVLQQPSASTFVRSPDAVAIRDALTTRGVACSDDGAPDAFVARADGSVIGDLAAEHGWRVHELTPQSTSLEDVFFELTGGAGA